MATNPIRESKREGKKEEMNFCATCNQIGEKFCYKCKQTFCSGCFLVDLRCHTELEYKEIMEDDSRMIVIDEDDKEMLGWNKK